jgi:hypothetical protein
MHRLLFQPHPQQFALWNSFNTSKSVDPHNASSPLLVKVVLTAHPNGLVSVHDSHAGTNCEMLRLREKTHQKQIPSRTISNSDTLKAGLPIQRLLQLTVGRHSPIPGYVDVLDPNLFRDMHCHPGTVDGNARQPSLVVSLLLIVRLGICF